MLSNSCDQYKTTTKHDQKIYFLSLKYIVLSNILKNLLII